MRKDQASVIGAESGFSEQDTVRRRLPVPGRLKVKERQAQTAIRGDARTTVSTITLVV